jgi:hypothetical protein
MHTYPEMNKKIVGLLKIDNSSPVNAYAAERIQELEAQNQELVKKLERALDHITYFNAPEFDLVNEADPNLEDDLRLLLAKAKGEVSDA